jgi:hypothetical protein
MESNRALLRGRVLYALSGSSLPGMDLLLSARIPHALQPVPLLVRDHIKMGACDSRRRHGGLVEHSECPVPDRGSTTVADGGMVAHYEPRTPVPVSDRTGARDEGKGRE